LAAVNSTDTFQNNGKMILHVKNGNGSVCAVTIDDPNSRTPVSATAFNPDVATIVPATTGERFWGPFDPNRFNDANGIATITYSVTASVTAEVIDCS